MKLNENNLLNSWNSLNQIISFFVLPSTLIWKLFSHIHILILFSSFIQPLF